MMQKFSYPTAFSSWQDGLERDDYEPEHDAIQRVIRSGQLTMGPEVAAFEREFADHHGRTHGIMVNSGSSANLVAVATLFNLSSKGLRRDDDQWTGRHAVVPALAWSTTYAPLVQHGLKLLLADCDGTWNAPVLHAGRPGAPRLAIICSILGNPTYGAEWEAAAQDSDTFLIEDNCESFGSSFGDRLCGTFGHMSTFSFFFSHQISAVEGGMILTDDDEMADLCRMLRSHGWTRDCRKPEAFQDEYDFQVMGYNVRPLEMHAAIAREQLKKHKQHKEARQNNALAFVEATQNLPIALPKMRGSPNPFGLHFICAREEVRAALVTALRANGIDCRLPTGGSFRLHRYGKSYGGQVTPNADAIHRRGLFLGNAPFDISDKIERAARIMRAVFDAKARSKTCMASS